jgi:hypothetical protein
LDSLNLVLHGAQATLKTEQRANQA